MEWQQVNERGTHFVAQTTVGKYHISEGNTGSRLVVYRDSDYLGFRNFDSNFHLRRAVARAKALAEQDYATRVAQEGR